METRIADERRWFQLSIQLEFARLLSTGRLCGIENNHGIGASQTVTDEWKHSAEIADGR